MSLVADYAGSSSEPEDDNATVGALSRSFVVPAPTPVPHRERPHRSAPSFPRRTSTRSQIFTWHRKRRRGSPQPFGAAHGGVTAKVRSIPTNFGGTFANKPRKKNGEGGGKALSTPAALY